MNSLATTRSTGSQPVASILFLDDEPAVLASLRSLFRREGYALHMFQSAEAAFEFLSQHPVDIIVSDMRMPEMGGAEFLARAAEIYPDTVRLMMSGYEEKTVVLDALARGLARYYVVKPWHDDEFRKLVGQIVEGRRQPRTHQLQMFLRSLPSLPSLPKSRVRLQALLSGDNISLKEVVEEIENDPSLVAKVLRVSNSVYFGAQQAISTIQEAVLFIGTRDVAVLVLGMEAFATVCKIGGPGQKQTIERLWEKSLRRAGIAKVLAQSSAEVDPSIAYITSLLQDIGHTIRVCAEPENYTRFTHLCNTGNTPPCEAEIRVFGFPHEELGAAVLEHWNFPSAIAEAVSGHHGTSSVSALVEVLQIAEALECGDLSQPHDPKIESAVRNWSVKIGKAVTGSKVAR